MTDTAINNVRWKESREYAGTIYGRESCIDHGLPPEYTILKVNRLNNMVFHLLGFIASEGCWEEAMEYLDEHMGEEALFEIS